MLYAGVKYLSLVSIHCWHDFSHLRLIARRLKNEERSSLNHMIAPDPQPYAAFLLQRLYRACGTQPAGPVRTAVETQWPTDGDVWAWTDDNAKILELLSHLVP
jgi:hypothetical protein